MTVVKNHDYTNEVQTILQVFLPNSKFICTHSCEHSPNRIESIIDDKKITSKIFINNELREANEYVHTPAPVYITKGRAVMISLFMALQAAWPTNTPWGTLTGVRPSKLVREWRGLEGIFEILTGTFFVSPKKAQLAMEVAEQETLVAKRINSGAFSIYIGIPFCPSRCLYCSFTMDTPLSLQEPYVDALLRECETIPQGDVTSVYIGGGTPTALSEPLLSAGTCQ